jgi:hypothetical protein
MVTALMQRYGRSEADARDTVLAGSVAHMQEIVGRLWEVGVDQLFIPIFLPRWSFEQLDRFITDVAPAVRWGSPPRGVSVAHPRLPAAPLSRRAGESAPAGAASP